VPAPAANENQERAAIRVAFLDDCREITCSGGAAKQAVDF